MTTGAAPLPVIFLMGPTASGKTAVAIDLIGRLPADIISVDSAMIYTGMDIGTAKPSAAELALAPHALIDILDPAEAWSVGEFCRRAHIEIERSHARGRLPILTGGTMMYFRALEHGLADLPGRDPPTRARIDREAQLHGWPHVHAELAKVDPVSADRIHPNDAQRLQRAMEVYLLTGTAMSEMHSNSAHRLAWPLAKFAIIPPERESLHERIDRRFEAMITRGFVDEVRGLYERGDLHEELPAIRSVGYRQLWQFCAGKQSIETAGADARKATRQLAKRQMTWIRGDRDLVHLSGEVPIISARIERFIEENTGIYP